MKVSTVLLSGIDDSQAMLKQKSDLGRELSRTGRVVQFFFLSIAKAKEHKTLQNHYEEKYHCICYYPKRIVV